MPFVYNENVAQEKKKWFMKLDSSDLKNIFCVVQFEWFWIVMML